MTIQPETKPDGGIRIEAEGITIDIDGDALEKAEQAGGLGFNYATTSEEHEALAPVDGFESPIQAITHIRFMVEPRKLGDTDKQL